MRRIVGILIFTFLITTFISDTKFICWDKRRLLTWEDFKSVPGSQLHEDGGNAGTCWTITHSPVEIHAAMNQGESWVINSGKTESGLSHEQGHFDIAEVYARKFRKSISGFSFSVSKFNMQYDSLYHYYFIACDSEEVLYDKETEHSAREGFQKNWKIKIQKELDEYETYNNPKINIRKHF